MILFKKLWPYIVILLISLILLGKSLVNGPETLLLGGDVVEWDYYSKMHIAQSLRSGQIPLWNPYIYAGIPFSPPESFYPVNYIYLLLPFSLALSLYVLFHFNLAGMGMLHLLRKKYGDIPALAGAVIFAFSGTMFARLYAGHLAYIASISYMPLVFGLFVSMLKGFTWRKFILGAGVLSLQILADAPNYNVLLVLEILFLYLLYQIIIKKIHFRSVLILAGLILTAVSFSAFYFFPFLEYVVFHSARQGGVDFSALTLGSLNWKTFGFLFQPFYLGEFPQSYNYLNLRPNYIEYVYFIGRLPWLLFLYFIVKQIIHAVKKQKTNVYFFFLTSAIFMIFLLALGNNTPLYRLLYDYFPIYRFIRIPVRHLMFFPFLAGIAVSLIAEGLKRKSLQLVIISIIIIDLVFFDINLVKFQPVPEKLVDKEIAGYIRDNIKDNRILANYRFQSQPELSYPLNMGVGTRVPSITGSGPDLLGKYFDFIMANNQIILSGRKEVRVELPRINANLPYIDFLNVKYVLSEMPLPEKEGGVDKFKLITDKGYIRLYENLNLLPRFFLVNNVAYFDNEKALRKAIFDGSVDYKNRINVLNSEKPFLGDGGKNCGESLGQVMLRSYTAESITLSVSASCDAYLSTSEVFYPYWKATIDGKDTRVVLSNLAFRAIRIPQGDHLVRFYYRPLTYYGGLIISAVSFLSAVVLWIREKRREKKKIYG